MKARTKPVEAPKAPRVRSCKHCGVVAPAGPTSYEWDFHIERDDKGEPTGTLIGSCSTSCRQALGLPERKAAIVPVSAEPEKTGLSAFDEE